MPPKRRLSVDAVRFGLVIRRLRLRRQWTMVQLASQVGLSATHLGLLERGKNVPTLLTILNLAQALGADAGEMVREVAAARLEDLPQR